jgi:outer membrane protein TolC
LELLLGRAPGAEPLNLPLPSISLPPATIPADVLARRPDVQAAFAQFQSATAEARSAYKALLPSLTLTGSLDRTQPALQDWMDGEVIWNLVGGLSQPLFDRGRRLAVAEAGDWTRDARWWSYRKIVLQALHEVHDALVAETALQTQVQIIAQAVESARAHHQVTLDRYRLGLVDLLDLIDAQEKQLDVLARQIRLQEAQLDNRVLLARALGLGVTP